MFNINESELLNRLIEILSLKKISYQNKLNDIEKRDKISNILLKYPNEPIKGIEDVDDNELTNIFTEFMGTSYTKSDIKAMKYWLTEGNNKEVLQKSSHYKNVIKSFEILMDKMQMYLDYANDLSISREDVIAKLSMITSLEEKLINNYTILDLSMYYSIIYPSETLTEDQIYKLLIAVSANNIKNLRNVNYKDIKINMSKEIKSYLTGIIENIIEQKEKEKIENKKIDKRVVALNNMISTINNDFDSFIKIYPDKIRSNMKDFWNKEDIDHYLDRLSIPLAVIKGKKKGINISFQDEDINIINEFTNDIKNKIDEVSDNNISPEISDNPLDKEIFDLNLIISKLKISSKLILDSNDFVKIISILKNDNKSYEYIVDIINILNALNIRKCCKELNIVDTEVKKEIKPINKKKNVSKQDVIKIESLFNKYGFNTKSFSPKLIDGLLKTTTIGEINSILEYIDKTKELNFLKDYTNVLGEEVINKEIQEIKSSQIIFILSYSNIEILANLIEIAKNDKLNLYDIFSIPKVFASKNNEELSGTYENFIINEKYIKEEYPEVLHDIMERYPFVLGTDSYLFRKNVELTSAYGMNIIKDSKGILPSPLALVPVNFEYIMDRYIEVGDYDYIESYRYQLETNTVATLRIKYLDMKNIDISKKEYLDLSNYFDEDIKEYLDDLTIENIPVALSEPLIKWLDSINEENNEDKRKIQYVFNGIYISRLKLLKYFSTLIINKYDDKLEALLYSMVKDSYLTEKEFNYLKNLVSEREVR